MCEGMRPLFDKHLAVDVGNLRRRRPPLSGASFIDAGPCVFHRMRNTASGRIGHRSRPVTLLFLANQRGRMSFARSNGRQVCTGR